MANSPGFRLLLVFYGNPDLMPMIFKEAVALREIFRLRIVCVRSAPPAVEWPGIEIERIRPRVRKSRIRLATRITNNVDYVEFIRAVRRRIREWSPNVLCAHDARAMVATLVANRSSRIPLIYRCHDIGEDLQPWHSVQGYLERYAARAGLKSRLVVQYSEGRAEHFRKLARNSYPNLLVTLNFPSLMLQPERHRLDDLIVRRFEQRSVTYPGIIKDFVAIDDLVRAIALLPKS